MKYLKITYFGPPLEGAPPPPLVTITDEDSLTLDIYAMAIQMRSKLVGSDSDIEIIESDLDFEEATLKFGEAVRRPAKEKNLDILVYSMIAACKESPADATIASSKCPLDAQAIGLAFVERVCKHPYYKGQILTTEDKNGEHVQVWVQPPKGGHHGNQHRPPSTVGDRAENGDGLA
jgi:hypothetical protein